MAKVEKYIYEMEHAGLEVWPYGDNGSLLLIASSDMRNTSVLIPADEIVNLYNYLHEHL